MLFIVCLLLLLLLLLPLPLLFLLLFLPLLAFFRFLSPLWEGLSFPSFQRSVPVPLAVHCRPEKIIVGAFCGLCFVGDRLGCVDPRLRVGSCGRWP